MHEITISHKFEIDQTVKIQTTQENIEILTTVQSFTVLVGKEGNHIRYELMPVGEPYRPGACYLAHEEDISAEDP